MVQLACDPGPSAAITLAGREATYLAMIVALFCRQFVSVKTYKVRMVQALQYLGIVRDFVTMSFWVTHEKLDKLYALIRGALDDERCTIARSSASQVMHEHVGSSLPGVLVELHAMSAVWRRWIRVAPASST